MEKYNANIQPSPEEWLNLDEQERMILIREYHQSFGEALEDDRMEMHVLMHGIVENQIAEEVEPVPATVARLLRQGLVRHEAIHAIAAVLSDRLWHQMKADDKQWDQATYRRKLGKLTAKKWRNGQW